jgi:hypothetical protein
VNDNTPFRSRVIVVALQTGSKRHKIFQVVFGRDGSLYVTFPYFGARMGILAATSAPASGQNTSRVNLEMGGKIASHHVKYSHHPDGCAQFSQTRKVWTEIKRKSVPLDDYRGHIFTVHIQGVQSFDMDDSGNAGNSSSRTTLKFAIEKVLKPHAVKFVGSWCKLSELPTWVIPSGKVQNGFLVASHYDNSPNGLFISCEKIPCLNPAQPEILQFIGGFDPPAIMTNAARKAGFLAFLYPVENAEELKTMVGTVDI